MKSRFPTYCYGVDTDDQITWVDQSWLGFARENGAAELTEPFVVGTCLWDFMADDATRALYQQIHQRVRLTGQTIVLPARCDSPNLKRHLQLTISSGDSGELTYRSVVQRVELQRYLTLFDPAVKRGSGRVDMCSCCQRLFVEPTGWVEIEKVAAKLNLFARGEPPRVVYSICPECARMPAELNRG